MGLREQIDSAVAADSKPWPFKMSTLKGAELYIHRMTPLQIQGWWTFEYGETPTSRPMLGKLMAELFHRCAVDENDKTLYAAPEIEKMLTQPAWGRVLSEFYSEARRLNFLFITTEGEAAERRRFFGEKAAADMVAELQSELEKMTTPSTSLSSGSQPNAENPIPTIS